MDIFEHARTHHRRAVRLVGQIKAAQSDDQRKAASDELRKELRNHEVVEAKLLYPALQESGVMEPQVGSLLGEHAHLKALGARILTADPHGPEWEQAVDELATSLTRHVNTEESQVFPRARNTLDVREIERLSRQADDPEAALSGSDDEGQEAAGVGEEVADVGEEAARKSSERMRDAGERAGEKAGQMAGAARQHVRSVVREQGEGVAGRGHTLADALREAGESLERKGEGDMARYVSDAADGFDRWMRRLEDGDIERITDDIGAAARRHPTMFFAAAVGVGFVAARFLKSSRGGSGRESGHSRTAAGTGEAVRPGL